MEEKKLRSGLTTGTCSAAAAKAAAVRLLTGVHCSQVDIVLPQGKIVTLDTQVLDDQKSDYACYGVQKDAGDDPDVTHQAWIHATVSLFRDRHLNCYCSPDFPNLFLTGGEGVGVVTKEGLQCPVGMSAINPVPRQMIFAAVGQVLEQQDTQPKLLIQISIPQGKELATKTFNPKLGIMGGISILGTSGVVNPMSDQALIDTIKLEVHMKAVAGYKKLIITPGNYGEQFLNQELGLSLDQAVKCSNFIFETISFLLAEQITEVLFVGHIGKLIKVAGGVKNTHSQYGDRRMEILADCIEQTPNLNHDLKKTLVNQVLKANTTEEALSILAGASALAAVSAVVVERIEETINRWSDAKLVVRVVMFSTVYGILGKQKMIGENFSISLDQQRSDKERDDESGNN